ncbi:MAG: acyl-CoA carboxylase subunit beta [Spirochaetia bacterium]|nr:acyl-CoA carboxylase subunit beta [Spirochaetia bacterium]
MTCDEQTQLLETMKASALEGGGKERQKRQSEKGKLSARERIKELIDKESFNETQKYITGRSTSCGLDHHRLPGDGVVTGSALLDGRQVWISSQDFTVLGGSLGEMHASRIANAQEAALKTRKPFIQINDSGGARIQEGIYSLDGYGKIFRNNIISSGVIPQISLILGPCAGGAAYSPALTDFVFMVDPISQMYITGPDVIKTVTGEDVTHDQLGGTLAHASKSGNIHFACESEKDCFATLKQLLSYLPSNSDEKPPVLKESKEGKPRLSNKISSILPERINKSYDMKEIIYDIVDKGVFLEVQKDFAKNIITGFARIGGRSVGIVANQPQALSGTLDIDSSDKGARFVRTCDVFNVPILSLVDVPGYMPGLKQEYGGIIRHGAKMLYAIGDATVPKVSVVVRKAYGGAYIAMASKSLGYDRVIALSTASIAVMGAEGAAEIIYRKEINSSSDPAKTRQEKIEEFQRESMNPFVAAATGLVDDVIATKDLRNELIYSFEYLSDKQEIRPKRKHGNMPL